MDTNPYLHIDFESYSVVCAVAVQDTNLSNPEMAYQFQFKNKNNWTIYKENMKNKVSKTTRFPPYSLFGR